MKATTNFALPYPDPGDHTRTWEYWQGLAQAVDTLLAGKFAYVGADGSMKLTFGGVTRPLPFAMQTGRVTLPFTAGSAVATAAITFAAGRFTQPPLVLALGSISWHTITAGSVTVNGAIIGGRTQLTPAAEPDSVDWMAVQMTPAAAPG